MRIKNTIKSWFTLVFLTTSVSAIYAAEPSLSISSLGTVQVEYNERQGSHKVWFYLNFSDIDAEKIYKVRLVAAQKNLLSKRNNTTGRMMIRGVGFASEASNRMQIAAISTQNVVKSASSTVAMYQVVNNFPLEFDYKGKDLQRIQYMTIEVDSAPETTGGFRLPIQVLVDEKG